MLYLAITVESLRGLRLSGLKNIRLQRDLTTAFQLIMGTCKKDREKNSTGACSDRTKGSVSNWKKRLWLDIKKKFFTVKMMTYWHRMSSEVLDAPQFFQGQVGWDVEKPGLVEGFPVYIRGLELADLRGSLPIRTILWLYQFI